MKTIILCLLLSLVITTRAQVSSSAPVSMMFVITGYDLSAAEMDKLMKTSDPAVNASEAYKHVTARVASRAVTVSSIAAITIKSGQRVALKTEGSAYAIDAILGPDGKSGALNVSVQRVARAVTKTASGNLEAGGVMFLGAVPAAKGGGQEILFLRMLLL